MNDETIPANRGGDANPDPITGEPGSHPIGTGVGAAAAGAAATAAAGAVAGPVGIVAGAVVGAVAGGLAGKHVAESMDPTNEEGYWQKNHATGLFGNHGSYDRYSAAYRTGYEGFHRHGADKNYADVEDDLKTSYEKSKDQASVTWDKAKHATREAYERARNSVKG